MRRDAILVGWVLLVAAAASPCLAHSAPFHFRIEVSVSAKSNDVRDRVSSYLDRELRSLGDVALVDDHPSYEIEVVALKIKNRNGFSAGYALSTVVVQPFYSTFLLALVKSPAKGFVRRATSNLYYQPLQWLNTDSTGHLERICKDIIATFDAQVLEPQRKFMRSLEENSRKGKGAK